MKRITFKHKLNGNSIKFIYAYGLHPSVLIKGVQLIYGDNIHIIEKDSNGQLKIDNKIVNNDKLGWCGVCANIWINCGFTPL